MSQLRKNQDEYIPALRYDRLTSLYDPLARWTTRESTFKSSLLQQASIQDNHRILDLGCGTATLTIAIKRAHPQADVVGLDGDQRILDIAGAKTRRAGVHVTLDYGLAGHLPYPDHSFDRVVSSLFFHHLTRESKLQTLSEVFRVLRPGGELHIADWGKAQNGLMRVSFLFIQLLDGFKTTTDNARGLLATMIKDSGFGEVQETNHYMTLFGTMSLYKAQKAQHGAIRKTTRVDAETTRSGGASERSAPACAS